MCGISGFKSKKYQMEGIEKMVESLHHRGPDAEGCYFEEDSGIGLGHNRLSIIDLTEKANQPFVSQCGRFVMVYNGEVYNFNGISSELSNKFGFVPRTNSDTEVILEAYVRWGKETFSKLNGMFSIAVWDKEQKSLLIARDRIGIKPLYYYQQEGIFAFGSEIKSLVSLLGKDSLKIDISTLSSILHIGYSPNDSTIYSEVKKLPAGSFLELRNNNESNIVHYWELHKKIRTKTISSFPEAKSLLKTKIVESVEKRLIADVPVGVFLSGGIDSSLVAVTAQRLRQIPMQSFSIGFENGKFNELQYAEAVAKKIGTHHHSFVLSEKMAIDKVLNLLKIYDEPFLDSSAIPTLLVSEQAKSQVKVALSGDGGDELFLGYGMYTWAKRMSNPLVFASRKILSQLLMHSGNHKWIRAGMVLDSPNKSGLQSHIFSQEQYLFSLAEINSMLKNLLRPTKWTANGVSAESSMPRRNRLCLIYIIT